MSLLVGRAKVTLGHHFLPAHPPCFHGLSLGSLHFSAFSCFYFFYLRFYFKLANNNSPGLTSRLCTLNVKIRLVPVHNWTHLWALLTPRLFLVIAKLGGGDNFQDEDENRSEQLVLWTHSQEITIPTAIYTQQAKNFHLT